MLQLANIATVRDVVGIHTTKAEVIIAHNATIMSAKPAIDVNTID